MWENKKYQSTLTPFFILKFPKNSELRNVDNFIVIILIFFTKEIFKLKIELKNWFYFLLCLEKLNKKELDKKSGNYEMR